MILNVLTQFLFYSCCCKKSIHVYHSERAKKLTNLDESVIKELIGEDDDKENKVDDAAIRKAKNKVKQRLAKERKASKQNNKGKKGGGGDDDDIDTDALLTFAGKKK